MESTLIETYYPITFREYDAKVLGEHLRLRHSVELVGMKRVGISNFLRFFLNHEKIVKTYINHEEKHLLISVDLNDLVERELFPFWILTFKRVVDKVEASRIEADTKKEISSLFLSAIQSQDLFLTIEHLRGAVGKIVQQGYIPTIFLIRFDRIKDAVNPEFFANLQGLKDATDQRLSFVFTSFRTLDELCPLAFKRVSHSVFSNIMYIKPANEHDMKIIFDTFEKRYYPRPAENILQKLVELCGGHVQYFHLCLIILNQLKEKNIDSKQLLPILAADERIHMQSEEIFESLSEDEKMLLKEISRKEKSAEKSHARYLWDTGIVQEGKNPTIFSPLFAAYIAEKELSANGHALELTKKEHMLFTYLLENLNEICDREKIIKSVWPEYEELGVSDWTIDRLVARLRTKLKKQISKYSLVTIKTRGYKLIEA